MAGPDPVFAPVPAPDASEAEWIDWADRTGPSAQLGFRCHSLTVDGLHAVMERSAWPINPNGSVHGGLLAAFADQCLGALSMRLCGAGAYPSTAVLTAHYERPATLPVSFRATVDRAGRKLLFLTVTASDADGGEVARFSGCMSVLRGEGVPGR